MLLGEIQWMVRWISNEVYVLGLRHKFLDLHAAKFFLHHRIQDILEQGFKFRKRLKVSF